MDMVSQWPALYSMLPISAMHGICMSRLVWDKFEKLTCDLFQSNLLTTNKAAAWCIGFFPSGSKHESLRLSLDLFQAISNPDIVVSLQHSEEVKSTRIKWAKHCHLSISSLEAVYNEYKFDAGWRQQRAQLSLHSSLRLLAQFLGRLWLGFWRVTSLVQMDGRSVHQPNRQDCS